MSFNWPDIPFSGTEVDAFVVAYKEFAQDVLDAYLTEFSVDNSIEYIHLPYMTQENMKIYLENALLYSAFVIKQRAGNSGPGTDFDLGNSPLNTPLTDPQSSTLARRLGCTFDNDKIDICYENGDPDNPDDNTVGPKGGTGGPNNEPPPGAGGDPEKDKSKPKEPCDDYSYNSGDPSKTVNGEPANPDRVLAWKIWAATLKSVGLVVALTTGRPSMHVAGDLMLHYLEGSGSQYTESGLIVADALGVEMREYVNKYSAESGKVVEKSVSPETRSAYGMSAGDKMYQVDFYSYLWLLGGFGTATIITDGTEVGVGDLIGDINYVKAVIDDYDFNYAYTIGRNEGLPGLPLDPTDTITSGPLLCPNPNDPNSGRSVCEALIAGGHSNLDYVVRLPVAEAHGDGCRDIDDNPNSGRPFPIYIKFNRTLGNGA